MSPIASTTSAAETKVPRSAIAPVASVAPPATPTPRQLAPAQPRAIPDAARDPRFDAAAKTHAVRRVVQQIAGLAYGAHVSVVSTATGVHATIDVSA